MINCEFVLTNTFLFFPPWKSKVLFPFFYLVKECNTETEHNTANILLF